MNGSRLDDLSRAAATAPSRRTLLGALLGGALSLVLGARSEAAVKRGGGAVCRSNADCASGVCLPADAMGRRRCQAPPSVVVTVGAFDGTYCPVTITLLNGRVNEPVGVTVQISGGSQFRPILSIPDQTVGGGLITYGYYLESATAELRDANYQPTGVFIPVDLSTVVCGAS